MTNQIIEKHFEYLLSVGTIFFGFNVLWGQLVKRILVWISPKSSVPLKVIHFLTCYLLTLMLLMVSAHAFPMQLRSWGILSSHFLLGAIILMFWLVLMYEIEAGAEKNKSAKDIPNMKFHLITTIAFLLIYAFLLYFSFLVEMSASNPLMWPGFMLFFILYGLHDFGMDRILGVLGLGSFLYMAYRYRTIIGVRFKQNKV